MGQRSVLLQSCIQFANMHLKINLPIFFEQLIKNFQSIGFRAARVCCIIRWQLLDKRRSELEFVDACNYEKSKVEDNCSPFNPTFDERIAQSRIIKAQVLYGSHLLIRNRQIDSAAL